MGASTKSYRKSKMDVSDGPQTAAVLKEGGSFGHSESGKTYLKRSHRTVPAKAWKCVIEPVSKGEKVREPETGHKSQEAKLHFKMEGLKDLKDLLRPNDFMVKIDLKDA